MTAELTAIKLWTSPLAFGVCISVKSESNEAAQIAEALALRDATCDMPDCAEPMVRVGVYESHTKNDKRASEFRNLCERHKQFGVWTDAEKAWGWE